MEDDKDDTEENGRIQKTQSQSEPRLEHSDSTAVMETVG